jgi:hypothetical protein
VFFLFSLLFLSLQYKEPIKWVPPFCCFPPCEPNSNFLWYLKYSCLQYAVFAPIAMLIGVICESVGEYGDGELNVNQGYLWVTVLINFTQLTSLYALAWLYVIMKKELMPFSPVFKFLVIKSVVFFTFWQGVGLAVLVRIGAINDSENFSVGQIQVGLQDFIICIEMFIAACCHKVRHRPQLSAAALSLLPLAACSPLIIASLPVSLSSS